MPVTEPLSHDDMEALNERLRLGVDASVLHGSQCGYLAGGATPQGGNLLAALQLHGEERAASAAYQCQLDTLLRQCRDALAGPRPCFEAMLPEDDHPLAERAEAVAEWCRGFLGGFGL